MLSMSPRWLPQMLTVLVLVVVAVLLAAPVSADLYSLDDGVICGGMGFYDYAFANLFTISGHMTQYIANVQIKQPEWDDYVSGTGDFYVWAYDATTGLPGAVLGQVPNVDVPMGTGWTTVDFTSQRIILPVGAKVFVGFVSQGAYALYDEAGGESSYQLSPWGGGWEVTGSGDLMVRMDTEDALAITAPADLPVEQDSPAGTPASQVQLGTPVVKAALDPNPVVTNDAPAIFPRGDTIVTWTAKDNAGNVASDTQTVTVGDTKPPTLTLTITKPTLSPPNHKLVLVGRASAVDKVDPSPAIAVTVTANEPIKRRGDDHRDTDCRGNGGGGSLRERCQGGDNRDARDTRSNDNQGDRCGDDANTDADFQVTVDGTTRLIWVRAERAGESVSRIYTITAVATDASGNSSQPASGQVTVPHDRGH